jgi:hypothetical protein
MKKKVAVFFFPMKAPLLHLKLMVKLFLHLTPIISHHPFFEGLRFRVHLEATLARIFAKQVMYVM